MPIPPSTKQRASDVRIEWCRQRLLVPGHPLTLTLPYAPDERRSAILALRTVISEIAAIPAAVGEANVARQKLDWWRRNLVPASGHPAILALDSTGALESLGTADFIEMIDSIATLFDLERFEQIEDLIQHCRRMVAAPTRLEALLTEPESDADTVCTLIDLAAAGYLVRIVRDLKRDGAAGRWHVPLVLQAEYRLSRVDFFGDRIDRRFDALIRHMLEVAWRLAAQARGRLKPDPAWRHRRQLLATVIDQGLATRIHRRPRRLLRRRIEPVGLFDAGRVWIAARQLRRAAAAL